MRIHFLPLPIAALAAIAFLAAGCATAPPEPVAAPPAALHVEGAPPLPQRLVDAVQPYTRVSGHAFVDWHPTRREMLVAHRAPAASTTQLYRLRAPMAPIEPLTSGPDPVSGASWEPREGRYIVFARGSGGDEAYQLHRLDPQTRETVQITPAGQRHALLGWVESQSQSQSLALVASVPLDRSAAPGERRGEVATTLWLVDPLQPAASRRVVATLPGGGWFGAEVAPDEQQVAITRYRSATDSEVWLVDLKDGRRRRLLPASDAGAAASHHVAGWSRDGRSLFVTSDSASEFHELMRLDGAALTRLSARTPWDLHWGSLSRDGRTAAVIVDADGRDELHLVDTATGAERALPADAPALRSGSVVRGEFHKASDELAFVVDSAQGPAQVHTLDTASGRVVAWTQAAGAEALRLADLPEQRIVRWKSFDGRTISGVLSLPPERFGGRRPVVVIAHGGPEGQSKQGWHGRWNYLVQELGIALLEPNVRGSSGYGKTFISLDNGRLREDSVRDLGAAIDWIATDPRLDARRVLVAGGSYGGYMALAASTRLADRIAGAVATVGISNFVSFLENTESYRRDLRRVEYGDERDPAMRAFLLGISPLTNVAAITKPLMVVQGKNDPRVPWTESEQIVRSLQQRGTPVWYLLADDEGHGFARRANADHSFATTVLFIERTLAP